MTRPHDDRFSTSWATLPILERLAQPGGELTSEEVAQLLRTRSVSGIASTMSWSRALISEGGDPLRRSDHSAKASRLLVAVEMRGYLANSPRELTVPVEANQR